ncbi:Alpha- and gamma-adaptin-binding p34 isoform 2 [Schistosoma japonicum]|uniref:Alpha-and gamma-adaptin-binding p34 isoform 2 n=1 Tax=Schistosoma japonicum TaxID=6182 RepID=B3W668_SCHJA|nr:alpha- and gamma-adaptin-binding protein p34 [Schistosoma japonicum]TNN13955.1 Alpha- and gamma-adaptin-binding p34 isoform 2 [Schistosoma japonicum]
MSTSEIAFIDVSEDACDLRALLDNLSSVCDSKFQLKIDCKYYSADIVVRSLNKSSALNNSTELLNAQGIIIYFSGDKVSSWNDAAKLMSVAVSHDISIRLLVCHTANPSALFQSEPDPFSVMARVILDHAFELVEISPTEDTIVEGEEFGTARIMSVLEAHIWPNMKPKDLGQNKLTHLKLDGIKTSDDKHHLYKPSSLSNKINKINLNDNEHSDLSEHDEDEFEDLLKHLPIMRKEIASLNPTDRYNMAEKITCKIWRAIGGSEEEIDGLHSDSS